MLIFVKYSQGVRRENHCFLLLYLSTEAPQPNWPLRLLTDAPSNLDQLAPFRVDLGSPRFLSSMIPDEKLD